MATQMSPDNSSSHSSTRERSSFGHSPPSFLPLPAVDNNDHPSKLDIREVQIDKRATVTNRSKHGSRRTKKCEPDFEGFYRNSAPASALSLDISEAATRISKYVFIAFFLKFCLNHPVKTGEVYNKHNYLESDELILCFA